MNNFRPAGMSDDEDWSDDDPYMIQPYPNDNPHHEQAEEVVEAGDRWAKIAQQGNQDESNRIDRIEAFKASIMSGDFQQFKLWIESGLSCDETFQASFLSSGKRPIFLACEYGQFQIVEYLLEKGASLQCAEDRFTPLMAVCASQMTDIGQKLAKCAQLLLRKTDPNESSMQQITALMFACKRGHHEVVNVLANDDRINLDAVDSQRWSALMYAVDSGFGHIARELLEKGANPNIASKDGTFPIDLAATKSNPTLYQIISHFSKSQKGINFNDEEGKCLKYSELDNVLLAVEGGEYIPNFKEHKADFYDFLVMNEQDLCDIGVDKVGVRKKMLETIAEIHKREWEKTSIPRISAREKQKGLYLTAPDGALIVASISKHFKYIASNVTFLKRHLNEKPEMLKFGSDVANVNDLLKFTRESLDNLSACRKQLLETEKLLSKLANDPEYAKKSGCSYGSKKKVTWLSVATPSAIIASLALAANYVFRR